MVFARILMGQCHNIFCYWFFSWISFPPAPEYSIRTISNFFVYSRRYSQVKVYNRYQWHRRKIAASINDTGGKFATGVNDTGSKQWEQLSNCWQLKMSWKKIFFLYVNSTTQRCPKEIMKIFLIEDVFHLPLRCVNSPSCENINLNLLRSLISSQLKRLIETRGRVKFSIQRNRPR